MLASSHGDTVVLGTYLYEDDEDINNAGDTDDTTNVLENGALNLFLGSEDAFFAIIVGDRG